MTEIVWGSGLAALSVLFIATAYLIKANWNAQLASTLLSVLLGGTVTLFIAVVSQLKESAVSSRFIVAVPFDQATREYFLNWNDERLPSEVRNRPLWAGMLSMIAGQKVLAAGKQPPPNQSDNDMFESASQLLQYKLLQDIAFYQSTTSRHDLSVGGVQIPAFGEPPTDARVDELPSDRVQEVARHNRYHVPSAFILSHCAMRLPTGATIRLLHRDAVYLRGTSKNIIVIERPGYFQGLITVEGLQSQDPSAPFLMVNVAVSMKATFFKLLSGSQDSADAKKWFEWSFAMLRDANTGALGRGM